MAHKLLFITHYTGLGGGETSLLTLVENLDPARFEPLLLVPAEGQLSERWRSNGWQVHLDHWRGATTYFIPAIWQRFPIATRIAHLIHNEGINLVHTDYHSLPFALSAAHHTAIPCVWTCAGWWFKPHAWQRAFFRQPDAAFTPSASIRDGFLGSPPFMPPERMEVLSLGVDTDRFNPSVDGASVRADAGVLPDAPLVAMIARFQNVKGHDVFQAMARQVALQIPEARFIVAGENTQSSADDEYKRRILHTAQTDPLLRERLVYLGFRADVERVIAASDVVVCSSDFEGYGMVNVEAMASGKPVVSTRRGGPSETVVDGETGYLVEPRDPAALAARVITLLRDPTLRARMGAAGRRRVEIHFSARAMSAHFTHRIESLL